MPSEPTLRRTARPVTWIGTALAVMSAIACESGPTLPAAPEGFSRLRAGCSVTGAAPPAECVTYTVWEDRGAESGRTIDISAVIVRAVNRTNPDPVVYFQGGPGGSSVSQVGWVTSELGRIRQTRDIVFVDQRGTGGSHRLSCPGPIPAGEASLFGSLFPADHLDTCRSTLEEIADLRHYATHDAVDDIAEVLRWLGYTKVNLFGTSYGTRVALVFLRRHPELVRTVLVNGVAPPHVNVHLFDAPNADRSLGWLADSCAMAPPCAAAHPSGVRADVDLLVARFANGPLSTPVTLSDGSVVDVDFSRGDLGYAIRGMLYGSLADSIPPWVAESLQTGGWARFADYYVQRSKWVGSDFATGMHLSVFCTEDYPLPSDAEVAAVTAGTVLGETVARRYAAACERWPAGDLPVGYHGLVRSDVPVLIVSGERDPATPAAWGEEIATALSSSLHVVVSDAGHVPSTPCVRALQISFFEQGGVTGLAGC